MRRILIFLFCCQALSTWAQSVNELRTPQSALSRFVSAVRPENYQPARAAAIINHPDLSSDEKTKIISELDDLFRGAGILLFVEEIPRESDYFDEAYQDSIYVLHKNYPDIHLMRRNGQWQFQPNQVRAIQEAHQEMFRFGMKLFSEDAGDHTYLNEVFFGLQLWQWIGIVCFIAFGVMLRLLISLFFRRLLMRFIEGLGKADLGHKYLLPVSRPAAMLVVLALLAVFYPMLRLPGLLGYYLVLGLKALIPLFGMIVLYRLVDILGITFQKLTRKTDSTLDDQLVPLIKKVLKVVVVLTGGLIIMDSLDVPILPLLTGLSIGGLAFALAAQDTIKNFFGSLMIFIDKPFQIGDWISSGDIDGTVEEVGFRSTRVRTFRNSVVYVPNGKLADSVIDNHGLRKVRRFRTIINIKYDTPPDRVEVFIEGLKALVMQHPKTFKENFEIHLNDMGESSLEVLFYIFFEAPTWSDELKFRQEIILDILKLGKVLSVHFAFPTQTVHVENLPGQESLSPQYTWTKDDLRNKLNDFLDADAK